VSCGRLSMSLGVTVGVVLATEIGWDCADADNGNCMSGGGEVRRDVSGG